VIAMAMRQENKINMIEAGEFVLPLVKAGFSIHGSISSVFPVAVLILNAACPYHVN